MPTSARRQPQAPPRGPAQPSDQLNIEIREDPSLGISLLERRRSKCLQDNGQWSNGVCIGGRINPREFMGSEEPAEGSGQPLLPDGCLSSDGCGENDIGNIDIGIPLAYKS
jgi:hypothetical protein